MVKAWGIHIVMDAGHSACQSGQLARGTTGAASRANTGNTHSPPGFSPLLRQGCCLFWSLDSCSGGELISALSGHFAKFV